MKKNINLSVVTVTLNNANSLEKTLKSLKKCKTKPKKIIIVDGKSTDNTQNVVHKYLKKLPVLLISETDRGIYDAMNKGLLMVNTPLVHYLNAGDTVDGDPYSDISCPCLIPVNIKEDPLSAGWYDFIKLCGYGYCHQGIIFPAPHIEYDITYDLGADFNLICQLFPKGLSKLKIVQGGKIVYQLGGISSVRSINGRFQILKIAYKKFKTVKFIKISLFLLILTCLPRIIKRKIASFIKNKV